MNTFDLARFDPNVELPLFRRVDEYGLAIKTPHALMRGAVHESAHAVRAHRLGYMVKRTWAKRDGTGFCLVADTIEMSPREMALFTLAGPDAEMFWEENNCEYGWTDRGAEDDLRELRQLSLSEAELDQVFAETRELTIQSWDHIMALARILVIRAKHPRRGYVWNEELELVTGLPHRDLLLERRARWSK